MTAAQGIEPAAAPWRELASLRVRAVRYRPGVRQPRHRHPAAGLSLVLAGQLEESGPQGSFRAEAGGLVFKPAGCWHEDRYGAAGAVVLQIAPRADDDPHWEALGWDYRWTETPPLTRAMLALATGDERAEEDAELAFWEAVSTAVPRELWDGPRWWPQALEQIEAALAGRVSAAQIARSVRVHPVHLARVCRRQLGCSLRQYLLERRTLLAWRACVAGERSLAAIAAELGFADQAHMTRTFASKLGISPARLRRLAAGLN